MRQPTNTERTDGITGVYESVQPCWKCGRDTNLARKAKAGECIAPLCSNECAENVRVMVIPRPSMFSN